MRRRIHAIRHRVGRRGQALLAFGFIDFVIGYSLIDPASRTYAAAAPAYRAAVETMPLAWWGWLWVAVGATCTIAAFCRWDAPGFAAAIGVKVAWALMFAGSWLIWDAPRGYLGAATWAVLARLVQVISRWPDYDEQEDRPGVLAGGPRG